MKNSKQKIIAGVISVFVLSGTASLAMAAAESTKSLKAQIATLEQRVAQLESQVQSLQTQKVAPPQVRQDMWDPYTEMSQMQDEMNRMFQNTFNMTGQAPAGMLGGNLLYDEDFNMKENKDDYVITLEVPGMVKDQVNIDITQNALTVSGRRSDESEATQPNGYVQHKIYSSFSKIIPVPPNADISKVKTQQKGEELVITIPKKV